MAGTGISKKKGKTEELDTASDSDNADGSQQPKSSKKLKLIALLFGVLVIVGGGAGAAWMFLLQPPDDEAEIVEAEPEVFPKRYLWTEPVFIAFVQSDKRRRQMIVNLTLVVEEREDNISRVKQALPRLREAYWRTLNKEPLPGADTGAIKLAAVKERLRTASDKILGPHVIVDVLVRNARVIKG